MAALGERGHDAAIRQGNDDGGCAPGFQWIRHRHRPRADGVARQLAQKGGESLHWAYTDDKQARRI